MVGRVRQPTVGRRSGTMVTHSWSFGPNQFLKYRIVGRSDRGVGTSTDSLSWDPLLDSRRTLVSRRSCTDSSAIVPVDWVDSYTLMDRPATPSTRRHSVIYVDTESLEHC